MQLKNGTLVRLETGGPLMLLRSAGSGLAYCLWFEGTQMHHGTFSLQRLVLANEERRTWAMPEATARSGLQHAEALGTA